MSPLHSADTLRVKTFIEIALSRTVFMFYPEIQDGRQKWPKTNFWEKSPLDSVYTVWVKNFVKIDLSRTVSEISVFAFYAEIQDDLQKRRESNFWKKLPVHSGDIKDFSFSALRKIKLFR